MAMVRPGAQPQPAARAAVVGDVRALVHRAADAVAAEVGVQSVAGRCGRRRRSRREMSPMRAPGRGGGDAGGQGLLGALEQARVVGRVVPTQKEIAASPVQPSSVAPQSTLSRSPSRSR